MWLPLRIWTWAFHSQTDTALQAANYSSSFIQSAEHCRLFSILHGKPCGGPIWPTRYMKHINSERMGHSRHDLQAHYCCSFTDNMRYQLQSSEANGIHLDVQIRPKIIVHSASQHTTTWWSDWKLVRTMGCGAQSSLWNPLLLEVWTELSFIIIIIII